MNIKHIKGLTMALAMSVMTSVGYAESNNEKENELSHLLEELANTENEFLELEELVSAQKVYVYDLQGKLVFALNESDLLAEHYRVIFQSDLIMESYGSKYYVRVNDQEGLKEIDLPLN